MQWMLPVRETLSGAGSNPWAFINCSISLIHALISDLFITIYLAYFSHLELYFVGGEENIPAFMEQNKIKVLIETLGAKGAKYFFEGKSGIVEGRAFFTTSSVMAFVSSMPSIKILDKNPPQKASQLRYQLQRYDLA